MAARKKTSKKSTRKTAKRSSKKATRKAAKRKVSKKKVAKKKVAKKKASKKKAAKKKVAKKKSAKKSAKKKVAKKKVAKKKSASKKTSKKKVSRKKISKKKPAEKKVSKKKKAAKKASKKAPAKQTSARKKPASKATSAKETVAETPVKRKILTKEPVIRNKARSSLPAPMNPADQIPTRPKRRRKVSNDNLIHGITPYKSAKGEEYMNDAQLKHFHEILNAWKTDLMQEVDRTVHHMQDEASNFPDPNDRATQESEFGLELRTRDRERKLLKKIAQAIGRTEDGTYGYCEQTGEEIGLKRLEARPVATLCVEAQERREVSERQYRDQDDHR
jgi:DnaK suppressor protein